MNHAENNPPNSIAFPRALASILAIVLALQFGCASLNHDSAAAPKRSSAALGKVVIIASSRETEFDLQEFRPMTKDEAANRGALDALAACAKAFNIFALILCPPFVIGAAIATGASTPSSGKPDSEKPNTADAAKAADMAKKAGEKTMRLIQRTIQESLQKQVNSFALARGESLVTVTSERALIASQKRDYRPFADAGVDTVVEVGLSQISNDHPIRRSDAPFPLRMQAQVRLIRTSDSTEYFSDDYVYQGEPLNVSEWTANQGERLRQALETGYEKLSGEIYDDIFLLFPFPDQDAHRYGGGFTYGLAPIKPLPRLTTVESLQPTLSWQRFPRTTDIAASPEAMSRVKNVRYDLVIAREHVLKPDEVFYRKEGLSESSHEIEIYLNGGRGYYWSVRARFEIDGRERVTEWSSVSPLERREWRAFHSNGWGRPMWTYPSWEWAYSFETR